MKRFINAREKYVFFAVSVSFKLATRGIHSNIGRFGKAMREVRVRPSC